MVDAAALAESIRKQDRSSYSLIGHLLFGTLVVNTKEYYAHKMEPKIRFFSRFKY